MKLYSPAVIARFWSKVDRTGGEDSCWIWRASLNTRSGYGQFGCFRLGEYRPSRRAHRVSWEIVHGPIPEGMSCLHHCDNPPCCNPRHLYVGTQRENVQDAWARGRNQGCTGKHWNWTEEKKARFSAALRSNPARPHFHALLGEQVVEARSMRKSGMSLRAIASHFGVGHATVKRALQN